MKSFIFATITGFALTLTLWSQLPDRQPAQEVTQNPQQAVIPTEGAIMAAPATPQPTTLAGTTSATAGAAVTATPPQPTTSPAAPLPQTLTPPANALYSMADVEKAYATYYAARIQASQELNAANAALAQNTQMLARRSPQHQWNPANPTRQANIAAQARIRQIQAAVSASAQTAFFEMAMYISAIREGLPMASLKRAQELLLVVSKETFSTDWTQGLYTQQAAVTQPYLMLNQTPATSISAPVGQPQLLSLPVTPTPTPLVGTATIM